MDLWDMKPDAPAEIRGPFKPIATKVPGIQLSEVLPLHAQDRRQVLAGARRCITAARRCTTPAGR